MQIKTLRSSSQGFTLLELLIVVILVGVLAAIALPNLLQQVAKGRQADAINNLGMINRAQQAYRYEYNTFGTIGNGTTGSLPIKVVSQYYIYSDVGTPSATAAAHYADVNARFDNDLKDYASSVGLTSTGVFSSIICGANQAYALSGVGNSSNGTTCGSNTTQVK